ncbi:hypothetical protein L226DRAFT_575310 [Lentinus tigrinus ALCF2SS1-7]|uniref:MYND-type domain-containing protein n=1 Tax=Lentinus tigrinus ALCF2SS1-6 TaxID=1328759 RepID=A0A5C2S5B4_9APHY|nr:hypothetical protein L227DRAFT_178451 [Lentinus tigrinus ALCF2SS1-6]RPD69838.1 hypothetical protein L226DRAFT_575310 [Lentinus tigrinus ALCF2SS1-7]
MDDPEGFEGRLGSLFLAVRHANASVVLGLASPVALFVGLQFKEAAAKAGVDVGRAREYWPLWRALKQMKQEREVEIRKDEQRVQPGSLYICAEPGCKIQGVHKSALKACAGRCPPDLKPRYCSAEYQKKDWPRHKVLCKRGQSDTQLAGALNSFLEPADEANGDEEASEEPEEQQLMDLNNIERTPGPARIIEIPDARRGEILRISSTTMSPREMRNFREHMMKRWQGTPSAQEQQADP